MLIWMLPLMVAAADPPLTPVQAMKAGNGAAVAVEFQVLAVAPYTAGTVALDFRGTRDDKQDQFVVVLSEKAQAQLKRIGVHDTDRHFRGKRVRVTGPVTAEIFTGLNMTGTYYKLAVDDIAQFERVD